MLHDAQSWVFVAHQAEFEINNDNDAEVSLQVANALTLALLSYRMKMVSMLVCYLTCFVKYVNLCHLCVFLFFTPQQ